MSAILEVKTKTAKTLHPRLVLGLSRQNQIDFTGPLEVLGYRIRPCTSSEKRNPRSAM